MEVPMELNKKKKRNASTRVSFSASLPGDVHGVFAESLCMVKYSSNPFQDIRESILEMIQNVGVQDWNDMEELIYCYIFINSSEVHEYIKDAFLSLCSPSSAKCGIPMLASLLQKVVVLSEAPQIQGLKEQELKQLIESYETIDRILVYCVKCSNCFRHCLYQQPASRKMVYP